MRKVLSNLKRFISACLMSFLAIGLYTLILSAIVPSEGKKTGLQGKYLTEEFNTKTDSTMIKVTYTFVGDSLYIDAYPSGYGIAAMSLEYEDNNTYRATECLYSQNTGEVIQERVYHLWFFPCKWDKNSYAVYRDGSVVDIIKKIP